MIITEAEQQQMRQRRAQLCDFGFTIAIGRSLLSFNAGETQVKQRQRADQQEDQRGDGGRRRNLVHRRLQRRCAV